MHKTNSTASGDGHRIVKATGAERPRHDHERQIESDPSAMLSPATLETAPSHQRQRASTRSRQDLSRRQVAAAIAAAGQSIVTRSERFGSSATGSTAPGTASVCA